MDQNRQKGFTLIELLITVVILGILLALAAPSFFEILERRKIVGATDLLHSDLLFAKTETIKRNKVIRISFKNKGTTNWCYGMKEEVTCDCTTANDCDIDGVERVVKASDFPNVSSTWTFGSDTAEFDPIRGFVNLNDAGTATFSIGSADTNVVLSITGRSRICSDTGIGGYPSC
ncbi:MULTISPECIES: GspH/FimT family pseudopilin [Cycloclasticus]|jgi:type IV fimbrial biogenesis protein FimT|uniref:Type II secretion system protein H n=1 Tax=Cycloclasticus pugetii TaxID=34068 RepID=A0AB33Z1P3_9GAMM|nr:MULTISPECIES: GspH/FimT family pseudopilin [Cycloclasticus]ATI04127.1 prepilin-type N-terminal cleavage/methylation domain-containing protein [Cycloclasticus sp. PY97N]EPD13137.1 Fimbrial protein pilin [Cycloclasticus pugetii]